MLFEVDNKNMLLEEQIGALSIQEAQETEFYRLRRLAEESTSDREQLAGYFFRKESDSIDFLNTVESLAPQAGVALKVESLEQEGSGNEQDIIIDLTFSGSYDQVTNFINLLENLPYMSEVTSLQMEARSSSNWEATTEIKIDIYAYDE